MTLAGGYTDVETPSSIPNLEAKHIVADDTLPYWDGNVGRCRLVTLSINHLLLHLPLTSNLFNQYVYLIHLFNLITYLFLYQYYLYQYSLLHVKLSY